MSKASEWASLGDAAQFPKPEFEHYFSWPMHKAAIMQVSDRPMLFITSSHLEAPQAIAFARWILDTFEDQPSLTTGRP